MACINGCGLYGVWVPDSGLAFRARPVWDYGAQFKGRLIGPRDFSLTLRGGHGPPRNIVGVADIWQVAFRAGAPL